jgi:tetratricopeptide (TPR) repeat protein
MTNRDVPATDRPATDGSFAEIEHLLFHCEAPGHFGRVETLLDDVTAGTDDPKVLAKAYAQRAHVAALRADYVDGHERLDVAEAGVRAAKRGLELDPSGLEINLWTAAVMGVHSMAMGLLSSLLYLRPIRDHAQAALELDESYASALAHQILADLYRLSPPAPLGMRNRAAARDHLLRARELAPDCPMAKIRLAELYLSLRRKNLAAEQAELVLAQEIDERGPVFADRCRDRARQLLSKARS